MRDHDDDDDDENRGRTAVVPFRPRPGAAIPVPLRFSIITTTNHGWPTTAIMRAWAPGDAARCRLCPRAECGADAGGICLVQVPDRIEPRDAAGFSLSGWRALRGRDVAAVGTAPGHEGHGGAPGLADARGR